MSHALSPPRDRFKVLQQEHTKSSSSLLGLEQAIAPQSKFAEKKSSIPADQWKPLPPPPKTMKRGSYGSLSRSPFALERRSSSIYSDVVAAWTDPQQRDSHVVPSREDFYKANRSNVRASMSEPQLLLPRTYTPLIATPSPTVTRGNSPLRAPPPPVQRPSELLPPPITSPRLPKEHLRTISLAKAQAMVEAPGSQHLLPEELRARKLAKSRSSEQVADASFTDTRRPQKPGSAFKPHESPTIRLPSIMMLDAQTWHTFDHAKHKQQAAVATEEPMKKSAHYNTNRHTPRKASIDSRVDSEDERGRTRDRVPRNSARYAKSHRTKTSEQLAAEYAAILAGVHDAGLAESGNHERGLGITSHSSPNDHGLSKPLASNRYTSRPLHLQQERRQQSPLSGISPKQTSRREYSAVRSDFTVDSRPDSPPPPKFVFQDSDNDKQNHNAEDDTDSRTGSIPISPPFDTADVPSVEPDLHRPSLPPSPTLASPPPEIIAALAQFKTESQMDARAKRKARESAYYPYVGRRRHGKTNSRQQANVATSRTTSSPKTSSTEAQSTRRGSDVPELISRIAHKAGRAAARLASGSNQKTSNPHRSPTSPATLGQSVTAVYLGWSHESKEDFDASKPVSPKHHYVASALAPKAEVTPVYEHVVSQARPFDERTFGSPPDHPTMRGRLSRSGSIFGSLLELRKEKGRERKREEIKKSIRVLPNGVSDGTSTRPVLVEKSASASDADVPCEKPVLVQPRMGLWGRRISEFGMI